MQTRIRQDARALNTPATEAAQALAAIAVPRRSGTAAHAYAAEQVRERMTALGYVCAPLPFAFSDWVGRFGVAAAAVIFGAGAVGGGWLLLGGDPALALVALLLGLIAGIAIAIFWTRLLHRLSWGRRTGENLLFHRPDVRPRYIVMAHLDTKSQLLPLAVRGPAVIAGVLSWLALAAAAAAAIAAGPIGGIVPIATAVAGAASVGLALSYAGNRSPGALDNASGVAAAVGIAANQAHAGDAAFLITDAEELGLAGARAAAGRLPPVHGVINLDGLDDDGTFYILERFGRPRRGLAPHLAVALLEAAAIRQWPARRRDVPFGLMLDHMPLVDAGVPALSVLRGEWRSLARVHRPTDDLARLTGAGVIAAVDLVCDALDRLRANEPG